jgi:uncharacterized protein (DUF1778 family)
MNTATKAKTDRINLRLKNTAKNLIERAASLEGKTVSNFILTCAMEQAEKAIQKQETMILTAKNSDIFFNALAGPVIFNKKLMDTLSEHDRRVTSK